MAWSPEPHDALSLAAILSPSYVYSAGCGAYDTDYLRAALHQCDPGGLEHYHGPAWHHWSPPPVVPPVPPLPQWMNSATAVESCFPQVPPLPQWMNATVRDAPLLREVQLATKGERALRDLHLATKSGLQNAQRSPKKPLKPAKLQQVHQQQAQEKEQRTATLRHVEENKTEELELEREQQRMRCEFSSVLTSQQADAYYQHSNALHEDWLSSFRGGGARAGSRLPSTLPSYGHRTALEERLQMETIAKSDASLNVWATLALGCGATTLPHATGQTSQRAGRKIITV